MELFKEYVDLVNFYDQHSSKPVTKTDLVPICELPEIFGLFGIQYQNKILAVGSKHLYTMQLSDGYYSISRDTHYHDLKKDVMLELPELISEPALVFYDFSEQQQIQNEKPSTLVFILDKEIQRTDAETGVSTDETLVCYINEPLNPDDRMTILATAFTKSKLDNYINNLIRNNQLLYLNEKKLHTRDLSGIQLAKSATMPLTGASLNNIRNYRENVNEKRMKESGLFLKDIPDEEKTEHVCKTAILNNPLAFQYIPENRISQSLIFTLIEKQNRFSFKFIPEDKFLDGVHYYFRKTKNHKKRPDIIYKDLLRLMTEKQQTMFLTEINKEKEPSIEEATRYIVEHSNNNISMKASRIPSHVQSVSDSIMSFDKNPAGVLEIIGKRFEVGQDGKPTLEGFKALSRAMEIYSDKHYETARYLFIRDGQITRHVAVSSQTPASTIIKPADSFLYELKSYARETGSRIVFLHNHPSGYVEPSSADVELTDYLSNFFTDSDGTAYFSGHIILDHGTYGLWSQKSRKWNALIDDSLQPISKIGETYKIQLSKYGKRVELEENGIATTSLMELSEFARECDAGNLWNTKDWVPGFLLTGNGIVTSFEQFGNFEFEDESVLCSKLKQLGRSYGSENIVFFPRSKEQFLMCERFAQDTGVVKDVYFENKDGIYQLSQYNGGNIFNNTRIDEIKVDDTQNYEEEVKERINDKAADIEKDDEIQNFLLQNTMSHTKSWNENFPDVFSSMLYKDLKNNPNLEELRIKAKSGDTDAAFKLVSYVADKNIINKLKNEYPVAVVCPVFALEATGKNKIPYAYANYLKDYGFEIDTDIIQSVKAYHTGANHISRFINRVRFEGIVQKGKDYILVDDHIDSGSTLRDLKDYIESNGGNVVAFSTLTTLNYDTKILPSKENLEILNRYGEKVDELLYEYGITDNKQGLTDGEVQELIKLLSDRSGNQRFEGRRQEYFAAACRAIKNEYVKKIKSEERTRPVYNRFVKLFSCLPQEDKVVLNDSYNQILTAIKSENKDVLGIINKFNFSKNNSSFSQTEYQTLIKDELIKKAVAVINKNINVIHESDIEKKDNVFYTERVNKITNKENKLMSKETKSVYDVEEKEYFTYNDFNFIPVRKFRGDEKKFLNSITKNSENEKLFSKNAVFYAGFLEKQKPIEEQNFEKSLKVFNRKDFLQISKSDAEIFYCKEKGTFYTADNENFLVPLELKYKSEKQEKDLFENRFSDEIKQFKSKNFDFLINMKPHGLTYGIDEEKDFELMSDISDVLAEGEVFTKTNENIDGEIKIKLGDLFDKKNPEKLQPSGLRHLIKHRMEERLNDGLSVEEAQKETAAILFLAINNIDKAPAVKEPNGRYAVYNSGIKTTIGKDKKGKYVVSGFDYADTQEEARDSIGTVIARYEYTPGFLAIYDQVGAQLPLLNIHTKNSPVNEKEHPAAEFQNKEFEQLKTSFESLQEKLNDVLKQNNELRKENEMLRNQQTVSDEKSANESISQNNKKQEISDSQRSQGGRVDTSFNRETAFKSNTKVPVFGHYNNDTRKIEIIKNAVFERKIEDDYDNSMNKIVLAIPHENGEHTQLVITEREYNKMINAVEKLEEVKRTIKDDTWEWTKAHQDYNEIMNLDRKMYRLNTPGNFLHNFRVHCIKEVHNPEDAMKIAALMVQDMTPRDKQHFNKMRRDYDKQYGKGYYDQMLLKEFEEISKEKEISPELLQSDFTNGFTILKGMNRELNELKKGQEINGTHVKVGDTIPLSLKCKSMDGKRIIIPLADYKIEKVTQNMIPNRAVLVNTKTNAIEIMPLNDLVSHIQKVEKTMTKEVNKELKKQHREYGIEGR